MCMKMMTISRDCLLKATMLVAALTVTTAQNTVLAEDEVTVGDVSNTKCGNRTRAESIMGHQTLKLTRFESGLFGELNNCQVNCAYGKVNVICNENGQDLSIAVDEGTGDLLADCICQINIYFTIFNALKDEYQLKVRGRDIGTVSFKEHSVVEIDLETLEQAYEEGFDYPVKAQYFWPYEITDYINPDYDKSKSLNLSYYSGDQRLSCTFRNYALPCDYSILDVQAGLNQDSTLVLNVLTDGIPEKNCNRLAHLYFEIVNILKDSYHLRLNHTILTKGDDGQDKACSVCLYEGDFNLSEGNVTIPITDNNDYKALTSDITSKQLTGSDAATPSYDLQGRRFTKRPQKGVYIQNGRKVVVE